MGDLANIKNNLILGQSELFGQVYEEVQLKEVQTFNDVSINVIDDWYNSILTKYTFLESNLIECLQAFFQNLKYVLKQIDPLKLNIQNDVIEDTDLLLWRESPIGISKLIFDEYGQVTYMFNGNNGAKQKGVFDITVDMQKLLFRFLSK